MRNPLSLNAMTTRVVSCRWTAEIYSMTVPSQPPSNLVLNQPHSPTFHNAQAFVDFERRQLPQVQPIFFNQFVATHKIGVHHGEHLNRDAKLALCESLRLEFSLVFLAGRPAEPFQRRQACKDDPGFSATESE